MFSFERITADDISQQIKRVDTNKPTQESDIPKKLLKPFNNVIVVYLQENFNNCLKKGTFPNGFKKAVIHPTNKKDCKTKKSNYRPIIILQIYLKFMNGFYMTKCILISVTFPLNIDVAFIRDIVPNIAC